jgi:hypothetical protein
MAKKVHRYVFLKGTILNVLEIIINKRMENTLTILS